MSYHTYSGSGGGGGGASQAEVNALISLSGRPSMSTDLGAFTGVTIPDGQNIKEALQDLESAVEAVPDALVYQGTWAASTNTPTLADGVGTVGDYYFVSDDGTVNFGGGDIDFLQGDRVVYEGTVWQKWETSIGIKTVNGDPGPNVILGVGDLNGVDLTGLADGDALIWDTGSSEWVPGAAGAVDSVNGQTGAVVLALDDLDDVNAPTPADGDALIWDNGAGEWVPGPAGTTLTVSDTNSINLTLTGSDLEADLILSAAAADAGNINALTSIEADGLQVQVPIADTNSTGVLTDTDWNTFNDKQDALPNFTANYVLYGDGTNVPAIDDDLQYDPSGKRLYIAGVANNNGVLTISSTGGPGSGLINTGSGGLTLAPVGAFTLSTNNVNAIQVDTDQHVDFVSTGAIKLPVGTTAQRPASPAEADIRRNEDLECLETYSGSDWFPLMTRFSGTFDTTAISPEPGFMEQTWVYVDVAAAFTGFGAIAGIPNGTRITIMGSDDDEPLTVENNDSADGWLMPGIESMDLTRGMSITFEKNDTLDRMVMVARSA